MTIDSTRLNFRPARGALCLLLLSVMVAIGCDSSAGVSRYRQQLDAQKEAAEAIVATGGAAEQKKYPQGTAWVVSLKGLTIDEEMIEHVAAFGRVSELDLSGSTISDEQLATLAESPALGTLAKLDVSNTQISDTGLLSLTPLYLPFEINVKGTKVTKAGIDRYMAERPKHPFGVPVKVTQ